MDNESDTFSVETPQKFLQRIPLDVDDNPFSMASNNSSSDFAQVMRMTRKELKPNSKTH